MVPFKTIFHVLTIYDEVIKNGKYEFVKALVEVAGVPIIAILYTKYEYKEGSYYKSDKAFLTSTDGKVLQLWITESAPATEEEFNAVKFFEVKCNGLFIKYATGVRRVGVLQKDFFKFVIKVRSRMEGVAVFKIPCVSFYRKAHELSKLETSTYIDVCGRLKKSKSEHGYEISVTDFRRT